MLVSVGREIRRLFPRQAPRTYVVTSPNVRRYWGQTLEKSLHRASVRYSILEMQDGEPAKRLATVEHLAEQLVREHADRSSAVLAFGGGVVGDSAGFLAAMYMRGIPVIQVPTTVVAQLDASIGGKTGVNLQSGKNLVGAFHQPRAVFVDPEILSTLEYREFRSGLFEALKCGVIRDGQLFEMMEKAAGQILQRDQKLISRMITASIRVKAEVVSADEKETGLRRILNFGHTVGHALESATLYSAFLHGEAVAWGMIAACHIAEAVGACKPNTAQRIRTAVLGYGPLPPVSCRAQEVFERLWSDKKVVRGKLHFVLPRSIGRVKIVADVPQDVIRLAVERICVHE